MEILRTENVSKSYAKKEVIKNLNITINKGDIYGFIGKNGAGKTTLMRMILTLAMPSSGEIFLFGSKDLLEGCKKVGALIETPALPKNVTAKEVLDRYSILYGENVNKTNDILKLVGLDTVYNKKVSQFSLGMKQRLGIGIALLNDPEFLILDEPLNGLDPMGMKEIRDLIIKLNKEKEITFLISSHLLEELSKTATKIGIINDGILVEEKNMDDIIAECIQKIVFTVDDALKAKDALKNILKEGLIETVDNNVYVKCEPENAAELNKLLVTSNVSVFGIEKAGYNLEDYYMDRIGAKHD